MADFYTTNDPTHGYEQINQSTRTMTEKQRILAMAVEDVRLAQVKFNQAEDAYISCRITRADLEKARAELMYKAQAELDARLALGG